MISKYKFEEEEIVKSLKSATKQDAIIRAMSKPAEKVKPWHSYRNIFITESRIENGVDFWKENINVLETAYEEFGINPEIIVSIIGIETNYGKNMGSFRVIDALSTLAFDYYTKYESRESRRLFFTHQLENLFLLAREQKIDPLSLKGSYAGAMGFVQFMPDNYRRLAIDFDEDGKKDILNNPADAIGSVANFLSSTQGNKRGWNKNGFIAMKANAKKSNKLIKSSFKLKSYKDLDIKVEKKRDFVDEYIQISLFPNDNAKDEFWLGDKNLYAITRYNPSSKYAMTVFLLSEEIASIGK